MEWAMGRRADICFYASKNARILILSTITNIAKAFGVSSDELLK